MAILSNINGKFAVDSTGAIQFSGAAGTSGYVLKSTGSGTAPTWVDPSTVIGGPYLPLTGGVLTGATSTASGISFTVGGILTTDKILIAKGQNVAHGASQLRISQESTTTSELRFYGADTGTAGILRFLGSSSDGSVGGTRLTLNADGSATFYGGVNITGTNNTTSTLTLTNTAPTPDNSWSLVPQYNSQDLQLLEDSTTRVTFGSGGNVGIGTTSPSYGLDVVKGTEVQARFVGSSTGHTQGAIVLSSGTADTPSARGQGVYRFNEGNDTTWYTGTAYSAADTYIWARQGSTTSLATGTAQTTYALMTLTSAGNVGIGTTAPNQEGFGAANIALSVKAPTSGGVANLELIGLGNADNDELGYVNFMSQAATDSAAAIVGLRHTSDTSGKLSFRTAGSERMRITETGNVGIGTTSPQNILHLKSNDPKLILEDGNAGSDEKVYAIYPAGSQYVLQTQTDAFGAGQNVYVVDRTGTAVDTHKWYTANTERMRITSGGEILIGTQTITSAGKLQLTSSNAYYGLVDRAQVSDSGNPAGFFNSAGSLVGYIGTNNSSTTYHTSSDYRLKEDLKEFNGLDIVSQIKTYDFKWKSYENRSYGVMAHELQEVIPDAVAGEKDLVNEDGSINPQGVDYSKIVPLLVKSIQELEARVKELENK